MNISFDGQLVQEDYLRAQYLHQNVSPVWSVDHTIAVSVFVLVVPLFLVLNRSMLIIVLPVALLGLLCTVMSWWLPRWQAANSWGKHKALQDPIAGTVTSEGIQYNGVHFKGDLAWQVFLKYKLSPELVLLYQGPNVFNMVPRHLFHNDDHWRMFVHTVDRNVPNDNKPESKQQRHSRVTFLVLIIGVATVSFIINFWIAQVVMLIRTTPTQTHGSSRTGTHRPAPRLDRGNA